jgi:hypothetical protein
MLTVHRDQEAKSMPKRRDVNETSQKHKLLLVSLKSSSGIGVTRKTAYKTEVDKHHKCL